MQNALIIVCKYLMIDRLTDILKIKYYRVKYEIEIIFIILCRFCICRLFVYANIQTKVFVQHCINFQHYAASLALTIFL